MMSTAAATQAIKRAQVFGEPQLHTDGDLFALRFADDGSLWSVEEPGVARHWSAEGRQLEWQTLSDLETSGALSRDVRILASANDDLTLWDLSSGQLLTAFPQDSWVTAVDFGPDPSFVATGNDDGGIVYWDAAAHQKIHEFQHRHAISALAVSPDGKKLATANERRVIALWDLVAGKHIGNLVGHSDRIPALIWHPSGDFIISAAWDATARIWDVRSLEPVILLNAHASQVTALAISQEGTRLATADSAQDVRIWDFESKKILHEIRGPQGEIRCLDFSRDCRRLAVSGERTIQFFDVKSGKPLAGSGPRPAGKTFVAVSRDNVLMASNGGGPAPALWKLPSPKPIAVLREEKPVHAVAFSPDGNVLAGAAETHVRLWDASGNPTGELSGPAVSTNRLAFSPDGKLLATGSSTGMSVWIWRMADGEPVLIIPDALDGCTVETLAFHPNGKLLAVGGIDWLATGGSNGAISFWDLDERCEIGTILGGTLGVAYHPSGLVLASTALDHSVCIWDTQTLDILAELRGHEAGVSAVAYSPDGKWLASGGEDRTLRLWNEAGVEVAVHELDTQIASLFFSPDGQYLFTGNANTTCYQFAVADLLEER